VVVGQSLFTAEARQGQAAEQEQRRRERRAARQRREAQARLREMYGDAEVIVVSVRPLFLD
jgi:signal transduction histidine kinase